MNHVYSRRTTTRGLSNGLAAFSRSETPNRNIRGSSIWCQFGTSPNGVVAAGRAK